MEQFKAGDCRKDESDGCGDGESESDVWRKREREGGRFEEGWEEGKQNGDGTNKEREREK